LPLFYFLKKLEKKGVKKMVTEVIVDKKFELGQLIMTQSIPFVLTPEEVANALLSHSLGNWGDICEADKKANDNAVANNDDRIFSVYHSRKVQKFYIITEWDRSVTTILLPNEY